MRILYVVPDGEDMGGIITSSEHIILGFRELGHHAEFARIRTTARGGIQSRPDRIGFGPEQWSTGKGSGVLMHPVLGWAGPFYSALDPASITAFVKHASTFDIVVWGALFGLKDKNTERTTDWLRMFSETGAARHVAMLRDDHFWKRQSWCIRLEEWVRGWACVHVGGFDLAKGTRRPRAVIHSPHDISGVPSKFRTMAERNRILFSVQTVKSWKRVDRFVAMAPHLPSGISATLGGDGIELRYMRSVDKCKPRYVCSKDSDPDATEIMLGQRIWENAMRSNRFTWAGPLAEDVRDRMLDESMFLVDLSMRESSGQINRVFLEAAKCGCVPIGVPDFHSGNPDGIGTIVSAYQHYLPVPAECTPKQLASLFTEMFDRLDPGVYWSIQEHNRDLLERFDRKVTAQQLIDLAMEKRAGHVYSNEGEDPAKVAEGLLQFRLTFGNV